LQQLREEEGVDLGDDDDESMWQGWDVESDNSDSDSEDEEWINVDDSDNNDLIISDSEDEAEKAKAPQGDATSIPSRISTLATTKVRIICFPCFPKFAYCFFKKIKNIISFRSLHLPTLPSSMTCE
jgi:hypothetical protein